MILYGSKFLASFCEFYTFHISLAMGSCIDVIYNVVIFYYLLNLPQGPPSSTIQHIGHLHFHHNREMLLACNMCQNITIDSGHWCRALYHWNVLYVISIKCFAEMLK